MVEASSLLWVLFVNAFLSSTLLPGGSEIALGALILEGRHSPLSLIATATAGNAMGGMTTYLLGYLLASGYSSERIAKPRHQRVLRWLQRWGSPALLLSWLPVVGDPLCFVAGWLRIPAGISALFIVLGKLARYLVVAILVQA
ncbi:MAG: DedA family protein [Proteobacteria bacterium]|nr:MAG: DedA family protein [Pseudomonadota bacterium]QKK12650.1 MAG: DedA family protein [Pseudomonadota bacterium]